MTERSYTKQLKILMAEKSRVLSKASAFADIGLLEASQSLWLSAASQEERIAPLLENLQRDNEAALHRISAASCYEKANEFAKAVNLYRAALAGPLREDVKDDVRKMAARCLKRLRRTPAAAR